MYNVHSEVAYIRGGQVQPRGEVVDLKHGPKFEFNKRANQCQTFRSDLSTSKQDFTSAVSFGKFFKFEEDGIYGLVALITQVSARPRNSQKTEDSFLARGSLEAGQSFRPVTPNLCSTFP